MSQGALAVSDATLGLRLETKKLAEPVPIATSANIRLDGSGTTLKSKIAAVKPSEDPEDPPGGSHVRVAALLKNWPMVAEVGRACPT